MSSLETAYFTIEKLVNDFQANEKYFISHEYSEIDARRDFIDKFFVALGWDIYHNEQKNPYEQEVKIEKTGEREASSKRADYAFFLTPNFRDPVFYVEAKKPSKDIYNPDYYYQAIRYGWNANNPIVVLTDFEEFHVIDSRYKPDIKKILNYTLQKYHYSEYLDKEKFNRIYYLFSHEAIINNAIGKYAETLKKIKGKTIQKGVSTGVYKSMDESFLEELDEIRNTLAKGFKRSNPNLESEALTEATQRTIDRLVFIRFLEDKLILGESYISKYQNKTDPWKSFISDCRSLDAKYNGIVFKDYTLIDSNNFTPPFKEDFIKICTELSHDKSPYDFNSIPINILGSIYERFLGKIVHVTPKRVTIEEKPEVRKAGGVYYTPQYIVKYIVDNTVGKIIEGKSPKEISKLRFADISCGSGSFLITVFDTLLQYYGKWYHSNPEQAKKDGCVLKNDEWILSLNQKKNILLNNIYGVDIDYQAVEVTQLSLYLKLLEDETLSSANDMQVLFKEKILPDLIKNIICGNSLIGTDILSNNLFDNNIEERKTNPMNFEDAFPEIMKNSGFDAIVGNPPYRMIQPHNTSENLLKYIKTKFEVSSFKIDLCHLFINKSIKCLRNGARLGYIIPTSILNNVYAENLRNWLLNNTLLQLISTSKSRIFENADVYTSVFVFQRELDKSKRSQNIILVNDELDNLKNGKISKYNEIKQKRFIDSSGFVWNLLLNELNNTLLEKLKNSSTKLENICYINRGLITGNRKKYFSNEKINDFYVPILAGSDVCRYYHYNSTEYVFFKKTKSAGGCWDKEVHLAEHKLIIRQIGTEPTSTLLTEPIAVTGNIFTIRDKSLNIENEKYYLAIINSKIMKYFWQIMFKDFKTSFPQVTIVSLSQIPIKIISSNDYNQQNKIVSLVDQRLESQKQLKNSQTDHDKTYFENKCNSLDRQIDQLVYELYGLTEQEIKIVEGKFNCLD